MNEKNVRSIPELFGSMVFSQAQMRQRLPERVYNNVKNTLNKAVPAEVAGLNRAFSSRTTWSKRNQVLKENNLLASATTMNPSEPHPLVADTPEAVSGKIINILDLNNQPEDFIHLLQPQEDEEETAEENQENTEEEEKENKEKADKTSENNIETVAETAPETNKGTEEKIKEEDDGVKHISVRRRFGQ